MQDIKGMDFICRKDLGYENQENLLYSSFGE